MLLVPVNVTGFKYIANHAPPSELPVIPQPIYTYPISGQFVKPTVNPKARDLSIKIPRYLATDAIGHPYQDTPRGFSSPSGSSSSCASLTPPPSSPYLSTPDLDPPSSTSPGPKPEANPILFNLLNQPSQDQYSLGFDQDLQNGVHSSHTSVVLARSPVTKHYVGLRNENQTRKDAANVMEKIISFVKNLDSFKHLSVNDQEVLFSKSWTKLFVFGMAQEKMNFDIIRHQSHTTSYTRDNTFPSLSDRELSKIDEASKLKGFLQRCDELALTSIEYAYIMGTILFDHDVPGLQNKSVISSLQMEALQTLANFEGDTSSDFPQCDKQTRLAQILLLLPALQSIKPEVVEDIFFSPSVEYERVEA